MSWTHAIPPAEATGALAEIYADIAQRSSRGRVSALWQTLGPDARGISALFTLYRALMEDPTPLTTAQAEMIAVVVSATNGCDYCLAHHGARLARALGDEALARAVVRDHREANLPARDRVLCDAAVALTCEPAERTRADVERMREYGFDDLAILRATGIAGFYNLVNRLALGLGVALEPGLEDWVRRDAR